MNNVYMVNLWGNENKKIIQEIQKANNDIFEYMEFGNKNLKKDFYFVVAEIKEVCKFWCGNTYVGEKKSKDLKNALFSIS